MNVEQARLLAEALFLRDQAARALIELHSLGAATPEAASVFVHEQRIINRLVFEDVDE